MDPSLVPAVVGSAAAAVSSVVALLTLMVNARNARKREERNRAWLLEDRNAQVEASHVKTQELHQAIDDVRTKTIAAQHATRTMLTNAIAKVQAKTEEGIEASKGAQEVANHARERLEQLGLRVAALAPKPREKPNGT